jgi:hypothetical protein
MVTVYAHKAPKIVDKLQRVESVDIHLSAHEAKNLYLDLLLLEDLRGVHVDSPILSYRLKRKLGVELNAEKES